MRFSANVQTGPGAHPASCTMGTGSFLGVKNGRGVTPTPNPLLVLWSTKRRAIPLLPLLAERNVQSLSACTVQLHLYSPYRPYGMYRASVPVQYSYTSTPTIGRTECTEPQCLYSKAIPLLPLWAVRNVQSLRVCTEPQCLYSKAIHLLPLWAVLPVQSLSACTVELYLYFPYGLYCLYRASVPLQECTLPLLCSHNNFLLINPLYVTICPEPFSNSCVDSVRGMLEILPMKFLLLFSIGNIGVVSGECCELVNHQ